jgi:hypothetical protein
VTTERIEYSVDLPDFGWKQFLLVSVGFPLLGSSPLLIFVAVYELVGALT